MLTYVALQVQTLGGPFAQADEFGPHEFPLPVQVPPVHAAVAEQARPSLHAVLLALGDLPHVPALQTPRLHWSFWAEQSIGDPLHRPPEHWSVTVHGLPSLQVAVLFAFLQPSTMSQLSSVQGLLSLQLRGVPLLHTPEWQDSMTRQAFPLWHGPASFVVIFMQAPVVELQTPLLHWSLDAEQSTSATPAHVPAMLPAQ
jgi:hypothetical protein